MLLSADILEPSKNISLLRAPQEPSQPRASIPPSLAVPWVNISKRQGTVQMIVTVFPRLGIPPIIVHSTISLNNWRKTDPEGPFSLPNLTTLYSLESSRSGVQLYSL